MITGSTDTLPVWAHLRESSRNDVEQGAYVNNLRIRDWTSLFASLWPGHILRAVRTDDVALIRELERIRRHGELDGYDDDELLTDHLQVVWLRPEAHVPSAGPFDRPASAGGA
jgi:hypothetical protein